MAQKFSRIGGAFRRLSTPSGMLPEPPPPSSDLEPPEILAMDNLWSWHWAGETSQHFTIDTSVVGTPTDPVILQADDISGNDRHWTRSTSDGGGRYARFQEGVDRWEGWPNVAAQATSPYRFQTPYAPFVRNAYEDGTSLIGQFYSCGTTMVMTGAFHFFVVMVNTRTSGRRDMWGGPLVFDVENQDRFILWQLDDPASDNLIRVSVGGAAGDITPAGAIPRGPVLIEVQRDATNTFRCFANGVDVSLSTPLVASGTMQMKGWGWDGAGTSHSDDIFLECLHFIGGVVSGADLTFIRAYLKNKWNLP